jgi:acyl-CoA hydrolase
VPKPTPRASRTSVVLSQLMQPADANFMGNIHGGVIMKLIDEAAGTCAYQFCRTPVVTAAIDRIDFHYPVLVGSLVVLKAAINYAGATSLEVGVRVEAEELNTGVITHTNSAYLVFVALDENRKPIKVPAFVPTTDDQRRRHAEAAERRRLRLVAREPRD